MAVGCRNDVRSRMMNGMMNHVCGGIEQADLTSVDDLAILIDADEVRRLDERERNPKRIDPERLWFYGVLFRWVVSS